MPNLILFIVCTLYPVVWALKYVFYQYGGYGTGEPRFVGFENLARVFRDSVYWKSVANTFVYGFGKIVFIIPLAFFLAFLLNKQTKGNSVAQSIIFLPTIMSSAVMGLVFYLLFNAYNGEVNKMLMSVHIINRPINWLGKDHAMQTLIITAIWGGVGNYMVYFIAGIQQVSQDAIESARIDGAGRLKTIWYIIIPMLGPILKIILMLAITSAFHDITNVMVSSRRWSYKFHNGNVFIWISLFLPQFLQQKARCRSTDMELPVSVVSAVITGIVTILYLKASKKLDDIY